MSPKIKEDKSSKTPQILGKRNNHLFRLQLFLPHTLSFSPPSSHSLGLHETERPMSEKGEFIWAHMSQLKHFLEEFACMFACVSLGRSVFLVWRTICHFLLPTNSKDIQQSPCPHNGRVVCPPQMHVSKKTIFVFETQHDSVFYCSNITLHYGIKNINIY